MFYEFTAFSYVSRLFRAIFRLNLGGSIYSYIHMFYYIEYFNNFLLIIYKLMSMRSRLLWH